MVFGISLQTFFSIQHARSATYFASHAAHLEEHLDSSVVSSLTHSQLKATVTGTLFSSVAFLEATINELFAEAGKTDSTLLNGVERRARKALATLWSSRELERARVINKFNIFLAAADRQPLEYGQKPGQDIKTLVSLRNALIHYKASWLDIGSEGMVRKKALAKSNLADAIRVSFVRIPGAASGSSDGWMSADCAIWAASSAIDYADNFFQKLQVKPTYDHVRHELTLPARRDGREQHGA